MSSSAVNEKLFASVLQLNRNDLRVLGIKDPYSLHRVVYGLFDDIRTEEEKKASAPSGIVYADKGFTSGVRQVLMLSNRLPHQTPQFGKVESKSVPTEFLTRDHFAFEVSINPAKRDSQTRKIVPIRGRDDIAEWFMGKSVDSWGFEIPNPASLQVDRVGVQQFEASGRKITHGFATIKGVLKVTDRAKFEKSFASGIGRGRAFGLGLLQISPAN